MKFGQGHGDGVDGVARWKPRSAMEGVEDGWKRLSEIHG
jgi:hypothetical protein